MTTSVTGSARPSTPSIPCACSSTRSAMDSSVGPVELLVYLAAYFARQTGHCLELLAGGGEEPLRRPEVLQQRPLAGRTDAWELVEDRPPEQAAVAAAAMVLDREAVRLVADPLQQARGLGVGGEVERRGAAGHVDLLQPLGEADDGDAALAERLQGPHPRRQLPLAAVDQDQ